MKKIILLSLFLLSLSVNAALENTITDNFIVTKVFLNKAKKHYEVSLTLMAGIYKADEKFVSCLQKSLESKKEAKITYEAMGLKITDCKI